MCPCTPSSDYGGAILSLPPEAQEPRELPSRAGTFKMAVPYLERTMRTITTILISVATTCALNAAETPQPLVELLFKDNLTNTGTLGGEGRLEEYAPGEGAQLGPGIRGMGLDLTASSRGGGADLNQAGGSVRLNGEGIEGLEQMTLAVWFKPVGTNSPARLLYFNPSWDLYFANGSIGFKTRHDNTDQPHNTPSGEALAADDEWSFVAVTFDDRTGEAQCYCGLKGDRLRHVCTWQGIPKLDRRAADLEIGNLSGIRPFRGYIDSVRLFGRVLTAEEVGQVFAMEAQPKMSLKQRAARMPSPPPLFGHGDICFSSRSIRPQSVETFKAFRANRLMWSYSGSADFIRQCKDAGADTYQGAINSLPGHSNTEAHCLDLEGNPMVAPWMVAFNREKPVYWGCNNRPQFMETSVERAKSLLDAGADWIQFDDWAMIVSSGRWGGACFCDYCMTGFREHLKTRLSDEERAELDLNDPDTFDYRRHLSERHDIRQADGYKAKYRSLPLTPHFEDFQRRSVRRFFTALRERINTEAGRVVPLSLNSSFQRPAQSTNFMADIVEFLQGETWHFDLARLTIACKTAEGLGKWQVFVPKPRDVKKMRMGVAAAYAMGQLMLVPWDMYMGSDATGIQPRYYGTVEEYGDLYHFVRDHADLLDGYRNPAGVGVIVDLDRFDSGRVSRLCRRLFDAQTPFAFVPVGRSYYPCGLNADRLNGYEILLLAADEDALAEEDRAALQAAADETLVFADADVSRELLASESPIDVWGPSGIYVLPRLRPETDDRTLVCHVLNRVDLGGAESSQNTQELKWVSFLVKRQAFLGSKLVAVRWHTPGHEPVDIDFERLANGARIIVPRLPIWGVAELKFEQGPHSGSAGPSVVRWPVRCRAASPWRWSSRCSVSPTVSFAHPGRLQRGVHVIAVADFEGLW